ncbi:MAG: glycosyltransferase [Solirubrobacterales bacterium]|nr:glycosyltransferase [Solirubrobacterales bacterium]
MALRLVQSAGAPAPDTPTRPAVPAAGPGQISQIVRRADGLLRARDLRGWQKLFEDTASIGEVHTRYVARRVLLEHATATRDVAPAALAETFAVAARAAVELLEDDPREPMVLNLAGVLLYELGALGAAEALFKGAERLDRELPHLERNLRESKRRRKAGYGPPAGMPPAVLRELRALGPRAEAVAAKARPATGLTLSLCMIVKDEEAMLPRCLAAVRDAVDELIVVDTGSTDRTVQIAEDFGARVLHHTWTGDFSAARNVSFDAATGDWFMFLDADEVLVEGDAGRLRAVTGRTWREGMFLVETNHTGDLEDGTSVTHNALRVFRNRPEYRFAGRIHEQIAHKLPDIPERLEITDVRIEHFGYLGAVRDAKEKSRRNVELLEKQVAEGGDSPFLHFNLGSEYGAAGEPQKALEHFRTAWQKLDGDEARVRYGFFPSLSARYVKALHACEHYDEAIRTGDEILRLLPGFTDVVFEQGVAHSGKGDADAAVGCFRRCLEMGDAPAKYSVAVGAGSFLALTSLAAVHANRGEDDEAKDCLRRALQANPNFIGPIDPYARLLLRGGTPSGEVVETVRALVPEMPPGGHFLLAVPLYEAGAVREAEVELRAVLAAQPAAHTARLALAEALLSQARLAEAAAEAAKIDPDAPSADGAARTELFALLAPAERDEAAVDAAVERARRSGVAHEELAAFEAWRHGARPGTVPAGAAPLVAMMLEALARIEDFEAFERLVAVAEALDLPWRERRELMATVYLRRGFLASAADEWISVVETEGPDVRAFRGLALVAERQELPEDAAMFRAEAEQLERAAA